jgi:hypothetical protein
MKSTYLTTRRSHEIISFNRKSLLFGVNKRYQLSCFQALRIGLPRRQLGLLVWDSNIHTHRAQSNRHHSRLTGCKEACFSRARKNLLGSSTRYEALWQIARHVSREFPPSLPTSYSLLQPYNPNDDNQCDMTFDHLNSKEILLFSS